MDEDIVITLNNTLMPTSVEVGSIWVDTSTMDTKVFDSSQWISINDNEIDLSSIIIEPVEFEDCMPDVAKVEDMCRDYPSLEKAYENFKTIYKMVHQDWVGNQKIKE